MNPVVEPLGPGQRRIVWTAWIAGGLLRLVYLLVLHPPMQHVYSDMGGYVARAQALLAGRPEGIADSLYPPGASWLFAALLRHDPNGGLAIIVQWLLALAIMAGLWLLARRLYGNTVAIVTLVATALYLPLFHYAGLFLAENPFTALLVWAWVLLLQAIDAPRPAATAGWGLGAGLVAGTAAAFKATILLPVALTAAIVLLWVRCQRRRGALSLAAGCALGLAIVLLPLAQRCTRLAEGHFCLVSTNTAMNALMGHAGDKGPFVWRDGVRNLTFSFMSPSASLRGHQDGVDLSFGAYDVPANLAELERRLAAEPGLFLRTSIRNVADLFVARHFWPAAVYQRRDWSRAFQNLYLWGVLPLALGWLAWRAPRLMRVKADSLPEWLLLAPILGLVATAFISLGELRFRIPFDGFAIILAAQALVALADRRQRRINLGPAAAPR
jgi:4-amino-4-deoxy-L-arabinose transferase-like glycosyltransferase